MRPAFHFQPGVTFAADVRGGSVGQVHADIGLAAATCFAGGWLLGLEHAPLLAPGAPGTLAGPRSRSPHSARRTPPGNEP